MDTISFILILLGAAVALGFAISMFSLVTGFGLQFFYAIYYKIFKKEAQENLGKNRNYSIKQGKEVE